MYRDLQFELKNKFNLIKYFKVLNLDALFAIYYANIPVHLKFV